MILLFFSVELWNAYFFTHLMNHTLIPSVESIQTSLSNTQLSSGIKIYQLPFDVWRIISGYIHHTYLYYLSQTSHRLRKLIMNDCIWRQKLLLEGVSMPFLVEETGLTHSNKIPLMRLYLKYQLQRQLWMTGAYNSCPSGCNESKAISGLVVYGSSIISGSLSGQLSVWRLVSLPFIKSDSMPRDWFQDPDSQPLTPPSTPKYDSTVIQTIPQKIQCIFNYG